MTKSILSILCLGLIVIVAGPAFAAHPQTNLESDLVSILEDSSVTGAGVVVVEAGAPSVEVYWGLARRDVETPVVETTVFRAGSISKNVTSLIAVRLAERGDLDLTAIVADIAPDIQLDNPWAETDPVRVVHLLEHTAGLPGSSYREYAENRRDASPSDYLDAVGELKLRWRPGTLYSYSNAGHTLLARAMEQATGQTFDELAQNLVFDPLAMESASFLTYGREPDRLARSYAMDGPEEPVWEMLIRPSGSLNVTPGDLAKLVAMYASNDGALVSSDAISRMMRSEASSAADAGIGDGAYGFGTFAFVANDLVFRGHWGKTEGFRANMGYLPGAGSGFVIMLNTVDEAAAAALRSRIAEHFLSVLGPPPPPPSPSVARIDPEVLRDIAGSYIIATHGQPMRNWLFKALEQRQITVTDDGLNVAGKGMLAPPTRLFRPSEGGGFAAEGFPLTTAAFVDLDGRKYWIDGDAFIKVSALEAAFRRLIIPAALFVSVLAVLHAAVWGGMGLAGRGPRGDGLWIRAALLASGVGFLATSALFANYGLLSGWAGLSQIGQPTIVSVSMAAFSVIAVIGGLAALLLAGRRAVSAPGFFLVWAVPASVILVSFAALWIVAGWFPLISWGW
ncbi:MAG: serine hydrolase domain-containing protein [Pseudomonadota bacterium]